MTMTRFARAKGSKSSNEKTPEEATSWAEMRKSVLDKSTKSTEIETETNEIIFKTHSLLEPKKATEWAQLDNDTVENYFTLIRQHHSKDEAKKKVEKKTKTSKKLKGNLNGSMSTMHESTISPLKTISNKVKNEKKGVKSQLSEPELNGKQKNFYESTISSEAKKINKKKRKHEEKFQEEPSSKKKAEVVNSSSSEESEKNKKTKKTKKTKNLRQNDDCDGKTLSKLSESKNKKENKSVKNNNNNKFSLKSNSDHGFNKKKKKGKFSHGNQDQVNRTGVEEIIVNGQKIQITKFQGFYVTAEDAERLKKLRSDMFKEGIPRDKLEAALKLERRRAEKALARLKKAVCFHCRRSGHVLSECPLISESQSTGTGICYKCGSTEHSALECKVVRGSNFQFAECFICKEQGHIAKQCPDNPRGLYPHGGGCRECGDVTHLRKDCPKAVFKKEEETMTVGFRNERNLESLDEEMVQNKGKKGGKSSKKKFVVKF